MRSPIGDCILWGGELGQPLKHGGSQLKLRVSRRHSRQIRQEGYDVPIIAVTADAMDGDEQKCLEAGCSGYLAKPVDKGKLIETLGKYLSTKEKRQ